MPLARDTSLYDQLGLHSSASTDEIRRSYHRAALQWHPDRNINDPAAAETFKACLQAYEILSDPSKRAAYDQLGLDSVLPSIRAAQQEQQEPQEQEEQSQRLTEELRQWQQQCLQTMIGEFQEQQRQQWRQQRQRMQQWDMFHLFDDLDVVPGLLSSFAMPPIPGGPPHNTAVPQQRFSAASWTSTSTSGTTSMSTRTSTSTTTTHFGVTYYSTRSSNSSRTSFSW